MKMTKIAFWRKVKENCENEFNGCYRIECKMCKVKKHSKECHMLYGCEHTAEALAYAEKQIKRHEQKCKKRIIPTKYTPDIQPDKTGAVLNKIVTLPKSNPTPLDIAKAIRDNGYKCNNINSYLCYKVCPIYHVDCGTSPSDMPVTDLRKQLIDDYIASHEKIEPVCEHLVGDLCGNAFETCDKECPANSEILKPEPVTVKAFEGCHALNGNECMNYMKCGLESCPAYNSEPVIEPIKFDDPVPEYVYKVSDSSIKIRKVLRFRRIDEKEADGTRKTLEYIQTNNGDYDFKNCYKTLDDAVAVAKAKWNIK